MSQCSPFLFPKAAYDVVGIAASAGGLKALTQVLAALPGNFPCAIAVVQHISPDQRCLLADILNSQTALQVRLAREGDRLQAGTVWVAPPDHHLLVQADGKLHLSHAQRINFTRPAADCLFGSIADSFKVRGIAVVLTGMGRDGAIGIQKVKAMGGKTLVQAPETAEFTSMPEAAIATGAVDSILPLSQISATLIALVMRAEGLSCDQPT